MKLIDIIENIDQIGDEMTIFLEDISNYESEIFLVNGEGECGLIKEEQGKKYHYLLEVFIAKEFIEDWLPTLNHQPTSNEIAKRVYEYGINDA